MLAVFAAESALSLPPNLATVRGACLAHCSSFLTWDLNALYKKHVVDFAAHLIGVIVDCWILIVSVAGSCPAPFRKVRNQCC